MKAIRIHERDGPKQLIYEDAPKPVLRRDRIVVAVASQERCPPFWLGSTLQKTPDRRSPGQPSYGRGFSMTGVHSCVGDFKSCLLIGS
jgi:NADPH:quinone reductase-like Zn-dependent oxidoreductase